ncbi:MAG: hypothetical protein DCC71_16410 [Proteobacteria bacterium]|nr:MAG: hypothetical protein DCC71_16410 [Pseudomonadota bacterium]
MLRRLSLATLLAGIALAPSADGEIFNVPCDASALSSAIAAVNGNGEEDFVWLAPACAYVLSSTWVVEADAGHPLRLYGRRATLSGNGQRSVLVVSSGATVHASGLTITAGKSEASGGGIANHGTLALTESTVSGSEALDNGGGIQNLGTLRLARSAVSGNSAGLGGGGIDNAQGRLALAESTVSGNTAPFGAGIRNARSASISNSTVFDNHGFLAGGLLTESASTTTLGNVTIAGNEASGNGGGGGIRNEGALAIDNSVVADSSGADCSNLGAITASGGNLVEDGSCAIAGALSGDPAFFAVTAKSKSVPLLPGSQAIDAGSNTSCPGVDQHGSRRPRDGGSDGSVVCDLGAHESACGLLGIEPFLVLPLARRLLRARRG